MIIIVVLSYPLECSEIVCLRGITFVNTKYHLARINTSVVMLCRHKTGMIYFLLFKHLYAHKLILFVCLQGINYPLQYKIPLFRFPLNKILNIDNDTILKVDDDDIKYGGHASAGAGPNRHTYYAKVGCFFC